MSENKKSNFSPPAKMSCASRQNKAHDSQCQTDLEGLDWNNGWYKQRGWAINSQPDLFPKSDHMTKHQIYLSLGQAENFFFMPPSPPHMIIHLCSSITFHSIQIDTTTLRSTDPYRNNPIIFYGFYAPIQVYISGC